MTRQQLACLLFNVEHTPYITLPDGRRGILSSIQREDGSGHCYNITVNIDRKMVTVFIRTID